MSNRDDQLMPNEAGRSAGTERSNGKDPAPQGPTTKPREHDAAREGKVSELARRGDPSLQTKAAGREAGRWDARGVAWVRPTDLVAQSSARWAGRGISLETELARRMRRLPAQVTAASRTAIAERARRLPPVSAFGRGRGAGRSGAARSGIGLG